MTRKKTSPVWMLNKKEMQELIDNSDSFVEVLKKLGLNPHSGNHRTLKERILKDSLNIKDLADKRKEKARQRSIRKKIPLSEIMVENSEYGTNHLKKRILEEGVLDYVCEKCKNNGNWMGKKLVLQLDHKNGNSKDHRLDNICFLCPNCHTQTTTYAGKNSSSKRSKICTECKGPTKGKGTKCVKCASQKQPKKFFVTKEELQKLVEMYPLTTIGKKFGVCGNSIKKRCISFGIEI